jgi:integrase/recombinase XerD
VLPRLPGHLDSYVFWLAANYERPATRANYLKIARQWFSWAGEFGLDPHAASKADVSEWLGYLARDHKSSTLRQYLIGLRIYYGYCRDAKLTRRNPAATVKLPRRYKQPTPEIFEANEVARLLAVCETAWDRAIVLLLYDCGLRRSELAGIRRQDISWRTSTIRIDGKGGKERRVPLTATVAEALRLALGRRDWLVEVRPGARSAARGDRLYWRFRALGRKCGLPGRVYLHKMRHSAGVAWCENGGRVEDLQVLFGHERIDQTLEYARAGKERRALEAHATYSPVRRLASP